MKEFFFHLWDSVSNFFVRTWNSVAPFFEGFKLPGFATMILGITFIFLLVIVIMGIKKIRRINKGELVYSEAELIDTEEARKPLFKLQKKDYIIMLVMCAVYSIPALYNLGSFDVPSTGWAPATANDGFVIDLGKETEVSKFMFYQGYNAEKYDDSKFEIKYEYSYGTYWLSETLDKSGFYSWKTTSADKTFKTSKIKVVANKGGAVINEIAVFEKGSDKPMTGLKILPVESNTNGGNNVVDGKQYALSNLYDEQELADYYTSYLTTTYFDEVFYPRTALDFINQNVSFERTHPPLGKYFVLLGMQIFGTNPFGWRIVGTLFGVAMIPLMYLFGLKVFRKRFFAFCTAFLMMFDFMHFVQTRISTIDVYVTFFIILMYYFMYDYFVKKPYKMGFKGSLKPLFLCGLFLGIGAATKWIALYGAVGIMLLFVITKIDEVASYTAYKKSGLNSDLFTKFWINSFIKTGLACVLFFILIPALIYFASYTSIMLVPENGVKEFFNNQLHMYNFHNELSMKHSYSSQWWSWPIMVQPIWYYGSKALAETGMASSIICMGNPLIWWLSFPALIAGIVFAIKRRDKYMVVPIFGALFQYIPWMVVRRMAFIYHYFSVIPFLIIIMVYLLKIFSELGDRARKLVYVYLGLVALLFVIFYPILSGLEVPRWYATILQWFPSWSFRY